MTTPKGDYARHPYPYIVAYCRIMSSNERYQRDEVERARKRNAPKDCYTCYIGEEPRLARDLPETAMLRGRLENYTGIPIDDLITRS